MVEKASAKGYSDAIRALVTGRFVTLESRLDHGGSLQARKLATGAVQLYWRYAYRGTTSRHPIGIYDPSAPPKKREPTGKGYGIAAAIETCRALAQRHEQHANAGGLRQAIAEERKRFDAAKAAQAAKDSQTLGRLLDAYVAHLKGKERRSYAEAERLFRAHVAEAWPRVASAPAVDVTPDDVLDMLRRLVEAGKGRTANKLRSYLRAAYQCAIDVRTSASIPVAFKSFAIITNPAAVTKRDPKFDRSAKHPLNAEELRAYWRRVRQLAGMPGAALRLHLLTGGQRKEQLLRLRWADVTDEMITIFDTKGRPGQGPRAHSVPLVAPAAATLKGIERSGEFVLSTTKGKRPLSSVTLSQWAHEVVGEAIAGFQIKRIRSGVETLLAAAGISREIRGHLQSHGLAGVQARHYDAHDYLPEKRKALEVLLAQLEHKETEKVVAMRRPRAGR